MNALRLLTLANFVEQYAFAYRWLAGRPVLGSALFLMPGSLFRAQAAALREEG